MYHETVNIRIIKQQQKLPTKYSQTYAILNMNKETISRTLLTTGLCDATTRQRKVQNKIMICMCEQWHNQLTFH